jgi:DNA-binding XRE family transcriptional regulator
MPRNVNDIIDQLSPAQRRKLEKRAAAFLAEELSLRELRRAHKLTQVKLAKSLGVRQEQISRMEQRSDLLISTLRGYVEAMGGVCRWWPSSRIESL